MQYNKYNYETYNLHTIKSDKFKSCHIEINFRDNITKESYLKSLFLSSLIQLCTKKYPRRMDLRKRSEELYQTSLFASSYKMGASLLFMVGCDFINPTYIKDAHYLENVLCFFLDAVFEPNIVENGFDKDAFELVKNDILSEMDTACESPMSLASKNVVNLINGDNPLKFMLSNYDKSEVESITKEEIYSYYKEVIEHYTADIIVFGDLDFDFIKDYLSKNVAINTIKNHKISLYTDIKKPKKPLFVKEPSKFMQSTLLLGYSLENLTEKEKIYVSHVFDYIFCNGAFKSKLFANLREKNSLCYGVSSIYLKFNKLYVIKVSLAKENVSKAIKVIKNSLNDMKNGLFEDEFIVETKKALTNYLKSSEDAMSSYINNCYLKEIDNFPSVNERIKSINLVTKEDIQNFAKKLKELVIYVLEDGVKDEAN